LKESRPPRRLNYFVRVSRKRLPFAEVCWWKGGDNMPDEEFLEAIKEVNKYHFYSEAVTYLEKKKETVVENLRNLINEANEVRADIGKQTVIVEYPNITQEETKIDLGLLMPKLDKCRKKIQDMLKNELEPINKAIDDYKTTLDGYQNKA
jgi:hypothetical protein